MPYRGPRADPSEANGERFVRLRAVLRKCASPRLHGSFCEGRRISKDEKSGGTDLSTHLGTQLAVSIAHGWPYNAGVTSPTGDVESGLLLAGSGLGVGFEWRPALG